MFVRPNFGAATLIARRYGNGKHRKRSLVCPTAKVCPPGEWKAHKGTKANKQQSGFRIVRTQTHMMSASRVDRNTLLDVMCA